MSLLAPVNPYLAPPFKANIQFMMTIPLHPLHDLWGYIEPNHFLSSLQP